MDYLAKHLAEMEALLPQSTTKNEAVSKESVGWHIHHNLKVINGVAQVMANCDPSKYRWKFNFTRLVVLLTGRIPRGRAKAPKQVRPPQDFTVEDVRAELEQGKKSAKIFQNLPQGAYFDHPLMGNLNLKKSLRFLEIHTEHHLKIVRDILAKR